MSEPFDFDAFIRGTSLARRTVSAFRVDNRDEIARLIREHDAIEGDDGDERETSTIDTRKQAVADRIATLRAEMEASRVEWVIRTLSPQEFQELGEDVFEQIGLQSRAPADCANPSLYKDLANLTADQWRQIATAIGSRQWSDLVTDANNLVLSKVAVPDFSPTSSTTQKLQGSSAS